MIKIHAFRALRAQAEAVSHFSASAFDSDVTEEDFHKENFSPYSYLHILNPQLFSKERLSADNKLAIAKAKLQELQEQQILKLEDKPAFYIYRQIKHNNLYTAIIALIEIEDYQEGNIKKHELTRTARQESITSYFRNIGINGSPVLLTHPVQNQWENVISSITEKAPEYDFKDEDGIRHLMWLADTEGELNSVQSLYAASDSMYIADGHHRCASLSALYPDVKYFMACIVPDSQLLIHGFHRYVSDLQGVAPEDLLASLKANFELIELPNPPVASTGVIGLYITGKWYNIIIPEKYKQADNPKEALDVYILDNVILREYLGIVDTRTSDAVHFINGEASCEEMKACVDSGKMKAVFMLSPVDARDVFNISDFGETMPPKSTWIEPKLRSGLLIHRFLY